MGEISLGKIRFSLRLNVYIWW